MPSTELVANGPNYHGAVIQNPAPSFRETRQPAQFIYPPRSRSVDRGTERVKRYLPKYSPIPDASTAQSRHDDVQFEGVPRKVAQIILKRV